MTTLDSSSGAESNMDDNGSNGDNRHRLQTLGNVNSFHTVATTVTTANDHSRSPGGGFRSEGFGNREDDRDGVNLEEEGDAEVWRSFTENYRQVQSVLDRNRVLIQQVNENHQSKIHDNMVKNVALIQEINGNISKVVSLYSDFSANFSTIFHQRNGEAKAKSNDGEGDAEQA